ncbi:MAG: site-2 protease family protein [Armatimonadota bacterium]
MRWSLQVGRLFGIPIRIHVLFFALPLLVALSDARSGGLRAGVLGALLILALFGCVVLHELGHSLVARRYGVHVSSITLLPIGGVAAMDRIPEDPDQELTIAIAGPLVNMGIAAILGILMQLISPGQPLILSPHMPFLPKMVLLNVGLAVFNLVPAFPMDGGRILRALLATRINYARATGIAAAIGRLTAFGFGALAILPLLLGYPFNPLLLFIALFVYVGATQEERVVRMRAMMRDVPVSYAMSQSFGVATPWETVGVVLGRAAQTYQRDFLVTTEEGRLAGILTYDALAKALQERGPMTPVTDVLRTDYPLVSPYDSLLKTHEIMVERQIGAAPVVYMDRVVGILTGETIGNYFLAVSHPPHGTHGGWGLAV